MTSGRTEYYYQQLSRVYAPSSGSSLSSPSSFSLSIWIFVFSSRRLRGSPARRCIWNARNVFEHERRPKQTYTGAEKEREWERNSEFIVFVLRPCLFILENKMHFDRPDPDRRWLLMKISSVLDVLYNIAKHVHLYNSQRSSRGNIYDYILP